jgi:hypothetical protein
MNCDGRGIALVNEKKFSLCASHPRNWMMWSTNNANIDNHAILASSHQHAIGSSSVPYCVLANCETAELAPIMSSALQINVERYNA